MAVDNEFLEHDPADEKYCKGRESNNKGQLGERDLFHDNSLKIDRGTSMPNEAHLKSRPDDELLIGEFARQAGIRPSAVRYYESMGLLPPPRRRGRWRVYGSSATRRLNMVVVARKLGFSIAELVLLAKANPAELRTTAWGRALGIRQSMVTMATAADRLEALAACQCAKSEDCILS